jgi:hypoxanthine phosphoribosyltransferase
MSIRPSCPPPKTPRTGKELFVFGMVKYTISALEIHIFGVQMTNNIEIGGKHFEIFLSAEEIQRKIDELAETLNRDYLGKTPVFLSVLNGAFMFSSDLLKRINFPCEIHFVKLSSYHGTESSGKVKELLGLNVDLKGRDVIVLEDIVDTGLTMKMLLGKLEDAMVASVSVCTFLFKKEALKEQVDIRYYCFEIPEKFVVGYGLDLDGLGRNLPHIYQIK